MNADGSGQRRSASAAAHNSRRVWSPDGDRIAFARWTGANVGIGVMSVSGSGEKMVTNGWQDEASELGTRQRMAGVPAHSAGHRHRPRSRPSADRRRRAEAAGHSAARVRPELVGSSRNDCSCADSRFWPLAATAASAQYQPYPYPQGPAPGYPQPRPAIRSLLSGIRRRFSRFPVLEADLTAKAGSDTVRFGRDSYVLTPQSLRRR